MSIINGTFCETIVDLPLELLTSSSSDDQSHPHDHHLHISDSHTESAKSDSRPCTVCKAVHLSCDRMRPCSRCVRLGRESDCCDPPYQKRGRRALGTTKKSKPTTVKRTCRKVKREPSPVRPATTSISEKQLIAYTDGISTVGCHPDFAAFLGYSQAELLGTPRNFIHPPELRPLYDQYFFSQFLSLPSNMSELRHSGQMVVMTKTGRRLLCAFAAQMYMKSGSPTMGILTLTDVVIEDLPADFVPPSLLGAGWQSDMTSSIAFTPNSFPELDTSAPSLKLSASDLPPLPPPDSDFWLLIPGN